MPHTENGEKSASPLATPDSKYVENPNFVGVSYFLCEVFLTFSR